MREEWIDITMPFGHPAGTWPGDAPFTVEWTGHVHDGEWGVNLSRFSSSPHNGTHSDAPYHALEDGATSESLPLANYLGPCEVIDVSREGDGLVPAAFAKGASQPRVLFKTRRGPQGASFPDRYAGLSEGLAAALVRGGVLLVGTDAPSVDAPPTRGLAVHKALFAAGAAILENLDLSRAEPGVYELVALPLLVPGLCAAPVRALLRRP